MLGVVETGEGFVDHQRGGEAVNCAKHVGDRCAAHVVGTTEKHVDGVAVALVQQALEQAEDDELHGRHLADESAKSDDGAETIHVRLHDFDGIQPQRLAEI
jgi:hypothetical protein